MASAQQSRIGGFDLSLRPVTAVLALAIGFASIVAATQAAQAQSFTVIHAFTCGMDGGNPYAGLTFDRGGNLYGTAYEGGVDNCEYGCGLVFKLSRSGPGWTLTTLHDFLGSNSDGAYPEGEVVFGPDGSLYGTTSSGGSGNCYGCGTVYNLKPPQTACKTVSCSWTETVLYLFTGHDDGGFPVYVVPVFDQAGDLYGTTAYDGVFDDGVVFKLTRSNGGWSESVIHAFGGPDGSHPMSGMIFDGAGNLYGTTEVGGRYSQGSVFELSPSGSNWVATTLYSFEAGSDGAGPAGGLVFDQAGNLYGTDVVGGSGGGGTVFELSPSGGSWTYALLYSFPGGSAPFDSLVMDGAGNLYGTAQAGGAYQRGSVFRLAPFNGGWTYTDLYDFTGGDDGALPVGSVTVDAMGNLYGTAPKGGAYGYGVAWEITP